MIRTKKDLEEYLWQDRIALGKEDRKRPKILGGDIWKFEIALRKLEYAINNRGVRTKVLILYRRLCYKRISMRLGFSIQPNVFDKDLSIAHYGTLVVGNARVGKNCRIHEGVCIGSTIWKR